MKQKRLISFIGMVCVFMSALFMMTGCPTQQDTQRGSSQDKEQDKKSKEQGKVIRERYGRVANVILDAIQGMREILSFNMWESYRRKINARIADYEKGRRADAGRRACELIYAIFISTMMTVSTLCISYHLYRSGSLAKQWILAVITVGGSIFAILGKFVNISTQFSSVFAASERVLNLLNLPITVQDTGTVEFNEAVDKAGLSQEINQYFAALTNMRSVGVMGDYRTYDYAIALRAVKTIDFMTAEAARLPWEVLEKVTNRIINEVDHVNRVLYDITSKPPGTIELE